MLALLYCVFRRDLRKRHSPAASPVARPASALGLEPHCRTSRCARPQPTPSPRYN